MGVSKTGFLYGVIVFYSIIIIFVGLLGNTTLKYQEDIPTPYLKNMFEEDSIKTQSIRDNQDLYFENACVSPYLAGEKWSFSDLIPVFLRPKCQLYVSTEVGNVIQDEIQEDYLEGISDPEAKGKFGFIPSIITGFKLVPDWLNVVIFTPLAIAMLFVLVTTIGGYFFDGGD